MAEEAFGLEHLKSAGADDEREEWEQREEEPEERDLECGIMIGEMFGNGRHARKQHHRNQRKHDATVFGVFWDIAFEE